MWLTLPPFFCPRTILGKYVYNYFWYNMKGCGYGSSVARIISDVVLFYSVQACNLVEQSVEFLHLDDKKERVRQTN